MKKIFCLKITGLVMLILVTLSAQAQPDKRVGIVYSDASANQFYDKFSYSQLFMAMQHQVMMAGIPYDLLTEDDLTSVAKLAAYDALIVPAMQYVTAAKLTAMEDALSQAVFTNGMGLIVAGNFMTNSETGAILPGDPYARMNQWLGINYAKSASGVAMQMQINEVNHPAVKDYAVGELVASYNQIWFSSFQPATGVNASILALLQVGAQNHNGVIATQTGGRNVHFASDQVLADTKLVWPALQWILYGNETPVGLKLSRQGSIFIARNDMDSSQDVDIFPITDVPLYNLLVDWKAAYNFVGSYYINIGNDPANSFYTDWTVSGPLFRNYIALGNEIGTHSWTHPDDTSLLSSAQLEFEFNQSRLEISAQLGTDVIGAAIPGNPESLAVDQQLEQYFQYVSGRYGAVGSGYPSAFGRMNPGSNMLYFSLNMSPDFTLIDFLGHTSSQAETIWQNEYTGLLKHASQPVIHWLWHDYGPTMEANAKYSVAMYANTIALAQANGSEFVTVADLQSRIRAHETSGLTITGTNPIVANVTATNVGQFSLQVYSAEPISQVTNWYAYDDHRVFLPENGGQFTIQTGATAVDVTRITALPMRARLMSVNGNGTQLAFSFEGEGSVSVHLNPVLAAGLLVEGADSFSQNASQLTLSFNTNGVHVVNLKQAVGNNAAPIANDQAVTTLQDNAVAIALSASDPDGDVLTYSIVSAPSFGQLSGVAPNLTYTPNAGFNGADSFMFQVTDGLLNATATVSINVSPIVVINLPPVASNQAVNLAQDSAVAITLSATDANGDALNYAVLTAPSFGLLSGVAPNLTYTANPGVSGNDSFTFLANDGALNSNTATVSITIAAATTSVSNPGSGLVINGDLTDWNGLTSFGLDPDDVSGASNQLDWLEGWMAHDETNLYLAFRNDGPVSLSWGHNIYIDTDGNAATGFHNGAFPIGAEYLIQGGYLYQYTGDGSSWSWLGSGALATAVSGNHAEFSLPRAALGNPAGLQLFFMGENVAYSGGTTEDYYPDDANSSAGTQRFFSYSFNPISGNVAPVANNQLVNTLQGSTVAITLTATDANGDALTYGVTAGPAQGQLTGVAPNLNYTPNTGYSGTDSFSFSVSDGALSSNGIVTINVAPVIAGNVAPVASDQSVTTAQDTAIAITLSATDANADPLTYSVVTAPASGLLSGTAPNLMYTPAAGVSGNDSFTFIANDGALNSNTATVSISVSAVSGVISNPVTSLAVNGDLTDWSSLTSFGLDPDDVTGASNLLDWLEGWVAHDATNMYLAFRNDGPITLSWGHSVYVDTDGSAASGFHDGTFPIGAEYLIQGGYLYQYTGDGSSWSWLSVGAITSAVSGNQAEFSLPRAWIGNPASLQLFFMGENVAYSGGTTEDYYPNDVTNTAATNRFFSYSF